MLLFESLILTKILKFHNWKYFIARARQPRAVLLEINGPFSIEIGNLESTSMWQMMCLASCCKNLGKFFSKDSFLETAAAWYCSHDQRISYWSIKVFSLKAELSEKNWVLCHVLGHFQMFCLNALCSKAKRLRIVLRHGITTHFLEIHLLWVLNLNHFIICTKKLYLLCILVVYQKQWSSVV